MHSIVAALTWEYWRRGWCAFVLTLGYLVGLPMLFVGVVLLKEGPIPLEADFNTLGLHYLFIAIGFLACGFAVLYAQNGKQLDFPVRLYALPAPAWLIVGCQTLQGVVTVSVLFWLTALSYELVFGIHWPKLGPTLFVASATVCLQAFVWSLRNFRPWKLAVYVPLVIGAVYWLSLRYEDRGTFQPARFWTEVTAGEVLTMLGSAALAFVFAVGGMTRGRRGEADGAEWVRHWLERMAEVVSFGRRRFAGPEAALFDVTWRRGGIALPLFMASGLLLGLAVEGIQLAWGRIDPHEIVAIVPMAIAIAIALPVGFGLLLGQHLHHQAALPITDARTAHTLLQVSAVSLVAMWLSAAAILSTAMIWIGASAGPEAFQRRELLSQFQQMRAQAGSSIVLLAAVAALLASWASQGLGVWVGILHRKLGLLPILVGELVLFGPPLLLIVCDEKSIGPEAARGLRHAVMGGVGAVSLVWSGQAFVKARRRNLISARTVWTAGALWLVLCVISLAALANLEGIPGAAYVLTVGLLTLPFTPLASVPLAVAAARRD